MPQRVTYACPNCGGEGQKGGTCPVCKVPLVACCPSCGNRIVGEHVHLTRK